LQRAQFGRRSEKLDPEQLRLALEDIEQAIAANEADEDKKNPAAARAGAEKRRTNRGALPDHLPRVDVTIAPDDTNCPCCRAPMHVIGEETSQRLDVIPAQFRVLVTHRPKYACRACAEAVVQAPAPERLIKGGLPTEAMVAYVLVAKFACPPARWRSRTYPTSPLEILRRHGGCRYRTALPGHESSGATPPHLGADHGRRGRPFLRSKPSRNSRRRSASRP
jgi:transposase